MLGNPNTAIASTGTFVLSGSGSLSVTTSEFVGTNGRGIFDQIGGTNVAASLQIGSRASGGGTAGMGNYSLTGGTLTVTGALSVYVGTLTIANVTATAVSAANSADISLTDPAGFISAGDLTILGNYNQYSTGELDIALGGLSADSQYSVLDVLGSASLDGTLDVSLVNGFIPSPGDTFEVIDAGSLTGTFANVILPDSTDYSVTYTPTGVIINVLPEPSGLALLLAGSMLLTQRRKGAKKKRREANSESGMK
jgi:hypothetical protein